MGAGRRILHGLVACAGYIALAIVYLAVVLAVSLFFFEVLDIFVLSEHFVLYFAAVCVVMLLLVIVLFHWFPALAGPRNRRAQDIAFMIAGLTALSGVLEIQKVALGDLKDELGQYETTSAGFLRYMADVSDARKECTVKPPPEICTWYIEGIKLARRQAAAKEWGDLDERLSDHLKLIPADAGDELDLDELLQARSDLSETTKLFVKKVFEEAALTREMESTSDRIRQIESLSDSINSYSEELRMVGFLFAVLAFSIAACRTVMAKET